MSISLYIPVLESLQELRKILKKASPIYVPRIRMLIEMKKVGTIGISKRELMRLVGASSQSIHNWRTQYKKGGLSLLLSHNKKGFKPSIFSEQEHQKLLVLLSNPTNQITGYTELNDWVKKEFNKEIKYNTLLKYCVHHFQSKVKVARKSHINKDDELVNTFKKTLVINAEMLSKK